jgi:hypothetical protein
MMVFRTTTGAAPVSVSDPANGKANCGGSAETQETVKITDGISGLVGLVPAA